MRVESSCVYGISAFIKKQAPESSPTPSIMKVKVNSLSHVQLFVTPGDPMDCNPPGFFIHGIFQARILEWVAISSY